jgi:hypothetical protein
VTRTVGDGEVVRVVGGYGWGYGHGWGFGFFLFPLLVFLLVFLLFRAFRGGWGPRYRGGGWYGGGYGYGPYGRCGPGPGPGVDERFEEQHRRAHAGDPGEPAEA